MNLINYKKNLFEKISAWVEFSYDEETRQYSLINDNTPWIFGVGETKEEAVSEYLSWLKDMILIDEKGKNEAKTIA
jgi:hypothetical protein